MEVKRRDEKMMPWGERWALYCVRAPAKPPPDAESCDQILEKAWRREVGRRKINHGNCVSRAPPVNPGGGVCIFPLRARIRGIIISIRYALITCWSLREIQFLAGEEQRGPAKVGLCLESFCLDVKFVQIMTVAESRSWMDLHTIWKQAGYTNF